MRSAISFRRYWIGPLLFLAAGSAIAGIVYPINLEHYRCVFSLPCGEVSRACWGPGHVWGSSFCTYCDGDVNTDLCERSNGGICAYGGVNQSCGAMFQGTCIQGTTLIGYCTGNVWVGPTCKVPKC